ncbi:MAG: AAA family ATPase [Candidatus Nealsonbacteria bacterium]|nr:AAA family ATPase [Candidatus Nealsonbacteria bacterium]
MRLDWISARNFRCFDSQLFKMAEQFNLFIGNNGTGKTAILDALAIAVGSLLLWLPAKSRVFKQDDVRVSWHALGETPTLEQQYPVVVTCEGEVADRKATWERRLNSAKSRTTRQTTSEIRRIATEMSDQVMNGESVTLPVVSYYGTGRLWNQKRRTGVGKRRLATEKPGSRWRGYQDGLNPASDEKRVLAWFKTQEMAAIQEERSIAALEAVRAAVLTCVDNATRVRFGVQRDQLMVTVGNEDLPLHLLSDGYHSMVAMIADIAIRAATLNPHLGERAALETPGVVLIDELDLHLHPKWQRRVVEDLMSAFPKIQFFATTHSPFIIQSLRDSEKVRLHNLDNEQAVDSVGRSVEEITEEIQGVKDVQRSKRHADMIEAAKQYYGVLQGEKKASEAEVAQLKTKLDELAEPFSDDPAFVAFLNMKRAAAGVAGE